MARGILHWVDEALDSFFPKEKMRLLVHQCTANVCSIPWSCLSAPVIARACMTAIWKEPRAQLLITTVSYRCFEATRLKGETCERVD